MIIYIKKKKLNFDQQEILKLKKIRFKKLDLTKPINLKNLNYDLIFNFAAILGVKNVNQFPYETFTKNILIAKNLIDFCKKQKKCKLINFSSSEVYSHLIFKRRIKFPTPEELDLTVLHNTIPRDSYGLSKLMIEKMCFFAKINYINIRPHNIYGPDMGYSHVIPELIKKIYKRKKISIISHNHKRAFCFIDDAINQIVKLSLNKNINNKTFNVGNPHEEIDIFNLAKKIKFILKTKTKLEKSKNFTDGSPNKRIPSLKKYTNIFGKIKFTKIDDGLLRTIQWYKNDIISS